MGPMIESDDVSMNDEDRLLELLERFMQASSVIKLKLQGSKPSLWRNIQVHADSTFEEVRRMAAAMLRLPSDAKAEMLNGGVWASVPAGCIADLPEGWKLMLRFQERAAWVVEASSVHAIYPDAHRMPVSLKGSSHLVEAEGRWTTVKGGITGDEYVDILRCKRYDWTVEDDQGRRLELWQVTALGMTPDIIEAIRDFDGEERVRQAMSGFRPLQPAQEKIRPQRPVDVQIKLLGTTIARTVRIWSDMSFLDLHRTIQACMGWQDHHLHEFPVGSSSITDFMQEDFEDVSFGIEHIDESIIELRDIAAGEKWSIDYRYDFGDGWELKVSIKKLRTGTAPEKPILLGGKGASPPEDVGGVYGFRELKQVLASGSKVKRDEYLEWMGASNFDPDHFDEASVQARLDKIRRM